MLDLSPNKEKRRCNLRAYLRNSQIISMLQDLQATLWPWCFVAPGVSLHVLKSRHAPSFWTRRILKFFSLWDTSFIYLSPGPLFCERHPSGGAGKRGSYARHILHVFSRLCYRFPCSFLPKKHLQYSTICVKQCCMILLECSPCHSAYVK